MNPPSQSSAQTQRFERFGAQIAIALAARESFVREALITGQMMREASGSKFRFDTNSAEPDAKMEDIIEAKFGLPARTGFRWMDAADRVAQAVFQGRTIQQVDAGAVEITGEVIPLSVLITTPDVELSPAALEAKCAWLAFIAEKSMKDCLAIVLTEGGEGHAVTRGHNGRTKGGYNGESRKDWPLFACRKLDDVGSHLAHCSSN